MARPVDYERSDISVRGAVVGTAILSVAVAATALAVWLLAQDFRNPEAPPRQGDPVAVPEADLAPPLQVAPAADMALLDARAAAILGSAAWVDRDAGIARVPVERAMRVLAGRGWPADWKPAGWTPEGQP